MVKIICDSKNQSISHRCRSHVSYIQLVTANDNQININYTLIKPGHNPNSCSMNVCKIDLVLLLHDVCRFYYHRMKNMVGADSYNHLSRFTKYIHVFVSFFILSQKQHMLNKKTSLLIGLVPLRAVLMSLNYIKDRECCQVKLATRWKKNLLLTCNLRFERKKQRDSFLQLGLLIVTHCRNTVTIWRSTCNKDSGFILLISICHGRHTSQY